MKQEIHFSFIFEFRVYYKSVLLICVIYLYYRMYYPIYYTPYYPVHYPVYYPLYYLS